MSTKEIEVCDGCGRETRDRYLTNGWLCLSAARGGSVQLTLTGGRWPNRTARTRFLSGQNLLFCSPRCLVAALSPFPRMGE
jgi:hypothetical protein